MSFIVDNYQSLAKRLAPVGKRLMIPIAIIRIGQQTFDYIFFSIVCVILVFIQQCLIELGVGKREKLTFTELLDQKQKHFRLNGMNRHAISVEEKSLKMFDIPMGIKDFQAKCFFRVDYYYDKYIVHALRFIENVPYRYITKDEAELNETKVINVTPVRVTSDQVYEQYNDTNRSHIDKFTPKPYILNADTIRKLHPTGQLVSQNAFGEISKESSPLKPTLTELFEKPKMEADSDGSSDESSAALLRNDDSGNTIKRATKTYPESKMSKDEVVIPVTKPTSMGSPRHKSVLYRIKIRRKSKSSRDPTYGNYDLLRQTIKNAIHQPSYPGGNIGPNMVRFTWHCCAHYDRETQTGGSSGGTMRFAQEFNNDGNTGLNTAKSYLDQIHEEFSWISFADLYTLGGIVAIEALGGPKVEWKAGRTDCPDARKVPPLDRLPIASLGADHIRDIFVRRLGMTDEEAVALIGGGHTIGGCHAKFSGYNGIWSKEPFKFDNDFFKVLLHEKWNLGVVPQSGMEQYFNEDKSLMMLNTDMELLRDPMFRKYTQEFANNKEYFFKIFAKAFSKLVELGVIRDKDGIQRAKI